MLFDVLRCSELHLHLINIYIWTSKYETLDCFYVQNPKTDGFSKSETARINIINKKKKDFMLFY